MAVLRSQRLDADTEFENTFMKLYRFSTEHTIKVAKRKQRWLCIDIDAIMNKIYRNLMEINECYFKNKNEKQEYINSLVDKSVDLLLDLEAPLFNLWHIERYQTKTMVHWVKQINKEIELLNQKYATGKAGRVMILDYRAIQSAKFLQNMSTLHRYTHSKVINADMKYDNTEGDLLISLVDSAFISLMKANKKIPTTKEEYIVRSKYISKAISDLKQMERRMLAYFNLMRYSERIMREWSDMLNNELRLLTGLQKSDKSRFGKLK